MLIHALVSCCWKIEVAKLTLFQTAGAEQLKAQPPKDVREQVVSSRLTCIDDLSERVGGATVSSSCR